MRFLFLIFITVQIVSCRPKPRPLQVDNSEHQEKSLLAWNQEVLENEILSIEAYLNDKKIDFIKTETGLYIYNQLEGSGVEAQNGNRVWVDYQVNLLDGTFCFKTDSLNPESFVLGKNRMPIGLNQGLLSMKEGGSASFIIPHYLLFGLAGDGKNIPPISPAIYKLRLVKVEKR